MDTNALPQPKVVYVCCNCREEEGARICCASQGGIELHTQLKAMVKERGYRTKIRVSKSGCMDRCEVGGNIMIFPDNVWLSHVEPEDVAPLVDRLITEVDAQEHSRL
jgi:(2Fe-2S) ferredoxin